LELFPDQAGGQVRRLEDALFALGGWLILLPDSPEADGLTWLYHRICDKLHAAEMALLRAGKRHWRQA
jgi:hypothetical protein